MDSSARIVALAGNPNVGKSSLFNSLTGADQHTGNWTGKTVETASGELRRKYSKKLGSSMTLVDLPGTYSISSGSPEELLARDYIKSRRAELIVVVCDACCLERSLILALRIAELTPKVLICVNLIDEARRKGISVDTAALEKKLRLPVVAASAASGEGLMTLVKRMNEAIEAEPSKEPPFRYSPRVEGILEDLEAEMQGIENDVSHESLTAQRKLGSPLSQIDPNAPDTAESPRRIALSKLFELADEELRHELSTRPVIIAEGLAADVVSNETSGYSTLDRRLDRIVTHPVCAVLLGILLLAGVFWLTIVGANYPSELLQRGFDRFEQSIFELLSFLPNELRGAIVDGMLRTLFKVVAVMLPPMAIFFPIFSLLEDSGIFARLAFDSDALMSRCSACPKQTLTMAMGLGCNAAGVVGCRIIDSDKERRIAAVTNNFMPCNGRFPILIALSAMLFGSGRHKSLASALVMTLFVLAGIAATLLTSRLLGHILHGEASAFRLELPPYRMPRLGQTLLRSLLDRTLRVLARAAAVAAPAGLFIWLLANLKPGGVSLITRIAAALDPIAGVFGIDGTILCALFLGFPANEIVLPLAAMIYTSSGSLSELELAGIFSANGWTSKTVLCVMLLTVFRFPCSTTLLTIRKEYGSRTALLSVLLPTVIGAALAALLNLVLSFVGEPF